MVFIDEAGCQLGMDRLYARAPLGKRAHCIKPYFRGEQINLIGAIGIKNVRCMFNVEGTVNGDVFTTFASQILGPTLYNGDTVIWDNLPAHKMQHVRRIIEGYGAHVIFLPPYSPDLNPIELLWSKLKQLIRGFAPKTKRAFNKAFDFALEKITSEDLQSWFKHCGYLAQ